MGYDFRIDTVVMKEIKNSINGEYINTKDFKKMIAFVKKDKRKYCGMKYNSGNYCKQGCPDKNLCRYFAKIGV